MAAASEVEDTRAGARAAGGGEWTAWYALGALLVVLVYAVVDRAVFTLLAEAMRIDLGLSDFQLGVLQGVGLSLIAAAASFPLAWLADKFDRRLVLAVCVLVWSLAVVACALAPNFTWLLIGAAFVGIGETGLALVMFASIPDLFPPARLAFANATAAIGKQISGAIGALICGLLITAVSLYHAQLPFGLSELAQWRTTFLGAVVALPLMLLLVLTLPARMSRGTAPRRAPAGEGETAEPDRPRRTFVAHVSRHGRVIIGFNFGVFLLTFGLACLGGWVPVIVIRYFGMEPAEVAGVMGVLSLVTGGMGFALGTLAWRLLEPRFKQSTALVLACVPGLLVIPVGLAMLLSTQWWHIFAGSTLIATLLMVTVMYFPLILQQSSPSYLRARVFSLFGVASLAAGALAPPMVGAISDSLTGVERPLLVASTLSFPIAVLIGVAIMAWSGRGYAAAVADSQD
jgi:MFS family permease